MHQRIGTKILIVLIVAMLTLPTACVSFVSNPDDPPEMIATEYDKGCADVWSIVHFMSGVSLSKLGIFDTAAPTFGALLLYELIEPHIWPGWQENQVNVECDLYSGLLGFWASELE